MTKVTCELTITLDGFAAGHNQSEERPFGDDGGDGWGDGLPLVRGPARGERRGEGARVRRQGHVLGRNMFGPVRGEWDRDWKGWWATTRRTTVRCSC